MKIVWFLLQKEFLQIVRDKFMFRLIFALPIVQMLILANAATFDIKDLRLYLVDADKSAQSRALSERFTASPYFVIVGNDTHSLGAESILDRGEADMVLVIPEGFEERMLRWENAELQLLVDAINGTKAGLGSSYVQQIVGRFQQEALASKNLSARISIAQIEIQQQNWYNPEEDYKAFMVPGILVMLVTLLSMFLASLNIVREKESGTIEQLNVTPIQKHHFLIAKLLPFALLSLLVLIIGLVVARIAFGIEVVGSLALVFGFSTLYLFAGMGLGILISNNADNQQQAMFTAFFFLIIFILMSGLFTPIESMPDWAQAMVKVNPLAYYIEFMRLVMLKGSGFEEVKHLFGSMAIYVAVANFFALITYRKVTS